MGRIASRFAELKARGEGALVAYVTAGDPSLERSLDVARAIAGCGVDILELGVPFSDPVADGPTIQVASQRALAAGTTPRKVLDLVAKLREDTQVPVCLLTYGNIVHRYGYARFAADAAAAGVDGVLVCDLPPADDDEWSAGVAQAGIDTIYMVAPTSTTATLDEVGRRASGFVYCVSRTGTTGTRTELPPDLSRLVGRVRERSAVPVCVGFGISTPDHVRAVCGMADGAIVGSALVRVVEEHGASADLPEAVAALCRELKQATHGG